MFPSHGFLISPGFAKGSDWLEQGLNSMTTHWHCSGYIGHLLSFFKACAGGNLELEKSLEIYPEVMSGEWG